MTLTILITIVSGQSSLRECLQALIPQLDFTKAEVIVPFDKWSQPIGELKSEFPQVTFHYIEELGPAASEKISAHQHRLYDRRRAVGLSLARGRIIAMTEDHAVPAENWYAQIINLHEQPFEVIGGAIENKIDAPLNRAWFYCDFGRYARPLKSVESAAYVSDVNVSYKREAIMAVRDLWKDDFHETIVHQAMRARGMKIALDERMLVYQARPPMAFRAALRERIEWGRVFAEARAGEMNAAERIIFAAGTVLLPFILIWRLGTNTRRGRESPRRTIETLPIAFSLLIAWSLGEMLGYISRIPHAGEKTAQLPVPSSAELQGGESL